MKKRIFIDMDEVMADAYWAVVHRYESQFQVTIDRSLIYEKKLWELIPDDHYDIAFSFLQEPGFFRNLKVIKGAQDVIKQLHKKHEVFIASAAMQFPNSLQEKSEWLDEHFSFISWQNRILCGHKYILRGDVLIDDSSHNLESFEGEQKLLFSSPHNNNVQEFTRVNNWDEVATLLL